LLNGLQLAECGHVFFAPGAALTAAITRSSWRDRVGAQKDNPAFAR
jgi:hypothetical protein